ncbi:MAG: molybdenum cofactor biosynthesis protein MoaE [bacterium]
MPVVRSEVTEEVLEPAEWWEQLQDPACGATVLMTGQVRDHHEGREVVRLAYHAYREMAQDVLDQVLRETSGRWPGSRVAGGHSLGEMEIGRVSVIAGVSAPHRNEAFEACRHIIDSLKERLPVWKRESGPGGERWQEEVPLRPPGEGRDEGSG